MSKDSLHNDPKSDLRFFIQELQQSKKQRQLFQIQLKAEELHGYISTLNIPYVTRHHLQGYLVLVAEQAHNLRAGQINKEDPERLEKQFYHVERPLNDVIVSIESILRDPKTLTKKVPKKTDKKIGIMKKLFGNKSQQEQVSDNEEPLEFDVTHEDHTGKIKVFITHKFVKSDQKLAATLQQSLDEHNIYGYLAERKKEYDLVFGEKMKNNIESSDYLIAIITKNSHNALSVHQEIGYALGVKVPVRIMAEEQEAKGVLIEGRDMEKFSRQNFEKSLGNIIKDVIKNGKRKKLTDKQKEELLNNVYRPCYNQMKNVFERREFITEIPPNPWVELEHYWKLKTESEIKELFEDYENKRTVWHDMWVNFGNSFQTQKKKLGEIVKPAFEEAGLLDKTGQIPLAQNSSWSTEGFLEQFRDLIFNDKIYSSEQLYEILHNYAKLRFPDLARRLEKWQKEHPKIFSEIPKYIPELIHGLEASYSYERINDQREILKDSIEKLTLALEEKLKS